MTRKELAEKLNGRDYRNEMTKEEESQAKKNGLIVIFGASDDLMEFRGAIRDEVDCYEGIKVVLAKKGQSFEWWDDELEETVTRKAKETTFYPVSDEQEESELKNLIEAVWCPEGLINWNGAEHDPSWIYKTKIPHNTFVITEDDGVYCQGIVIDVNDL